jgi:hypothetical protein
MYEAESRPAAPATARERNPWARNLAIAAGILLVAAAGFIGLRRTMIPARDHVGYAAPARATTKIGTTTPTPTAGDETAPASSRPVAKKTATKTAPSAPTPPR